MKVRTTFLLFVFTLFTSISGALLGIDLGNDFTKAALVAPGVPFEIVMSADSKRKDVSGLALKSLGSDNEIERLYGSATNSHCTRFPHTCLLNIKPLLGKSYDDPVVQHYLESHPGVEIVPSKGNRTTISFNIDGQTYPIEEVLAMNLQNIVGRAALILKEKSPGGYSQINDVAITVPSYFNHAQRNAVIDAASLAGLSVAGLVDDGLAIAVNYATKTEFAIGKEYHIIYDMGAGSTRATLVSFTKVDDQTPLKINVEGYGFDEHLGGSLFTKSIAELLKGRFLESHPKIHSTEFQANNRAIAKIYQASEKAKLVLSANNEASVSIESLYDDIDFKTKITRSEFEEDLTDVASRITKPITDALQNQFISRVALSDIKSVIYAGGATRVPFVQQHLLSLIGENLVSKTINADEAAVLGTTLRGVQISKIFKSKDLNVTESSLFEYQVISDDGKEIVVFTKGSTYGSTNEIDLTEIISKNNGLGLDTLEGTKRYTRYDSSDLESILSKSFNETECPSGVKFLGEFTLTESRIFKLSGLYSVCTDDEIKPGLLKQLETAEGNKKTKTKIKKVPFKTSYIGYRPLGSTLEQELRSHLHTLDSKDHQRKLVSEKLNELESTLYSARAYLDEDEVTEKGPKSVVDHAANLVSQYLEWLDYESDGAKVKQIKDKSQEVTAIINQIKEYISQLSIPLDEEEFKRIHQEGVLAINSIQETLLDISEEALEIAKNFTAVDLDYEKETKKLTKFARSISQDTIEKKSKDLIKTFEKVKELNENPKKFKKTSREDLFKIRSQALEKLSDVEQIQQQLKAVHAQRVKELNAALIRHLRAKSRAAEKAAAKLRDEENAKSKNDEQEQKDPVDYEENFEAPIDSTEKDSTKTASDNLHDEL